jgi:phosphotransferase system HPr (HPr) family protein
MVEVSGLGVMFEGDPGLGKSETALGLIKRGCALIADDLTCVRREVGGNELYGSASESTAGYMEIRGIGIVHVPSLFGVSAVRGEKRLDLVITFKRLQDVVGEIDRIGQTRRVRNILGVDVSNIIIPVSAGRDLVNLVETAAMQQRLLISGGDPVLELSERLRKRAEASKPASDAADVKRKGRKMSDKIVRKMTLLNKYGLHVRPAGLFARTASHYDATIDVEKDGNVVSGKSIMALMTLEAVSGTVLTVTAEGPQAKEALDDLEALVARKFDIPD